MPLFRIVIGTLYIYLGLDSMETLEEFVILGFAFLVPLCSNILTFLFLSVYLAVLHLLDVYVICYCEDLCVKLSIGTTTSALQKSNKFHETFMKYIHLRGRS